MTAPGAPSSAPSPDDAFGRWLMAHPAATLLEVAAFLAASKVVAPRLQGNPDPARRAAPGCEERIVR
jgi:hypothetical protein